MRYPRGSVGGMVVCGEASTNEGKARRRFVKGALQGGMEVKQTSDGETELVLKALLEDFGRAYGLSRREQEIVALASTGHRTKEISDALGCATQTIGTYWERIYRKTKHTSR